MEEERLEAVARNSAWEKEGAKGRVRLLRARVSVELGKVVSGSATKDLWLGDRKMGSQVSGINRSLCLREKVLGKLGEEEDKEGEPSMEQRRDNTVFGLDLGEKEKQVVYHVSALALAMTDKARRESEM